MSNDEWTPIGQGRWRKGDDLLINWDGGQIQHFFGYFRPEQVAHRKRWAEAVAAELKPIVARFGKVTPV